MAWPRTRRSSEGLTDQNAEGEPACSLILVGRDLADVGERPRAVELLRARYSPAQIHADWPDRGGVAQAKAEREVQLREVELRHAGADVGRVGEDNHPPRA